MEIFHVGQAERRLTAIFYAGNEEKPKRTAVIICNPIGQEYIRFYKATVVLARALSLHGFPTFRFDYYGTGDSYGDENDFNISSSTEDLKIILNEIKDGCDIDNICAIGIRYGTILNMLCGESLNINSHVLWNPIISGAVYLNELKLQHKKLINGSFINSANIEKHERLGFGLSEQLIKDLRSFSMSELSTESSDEILILADQDNVSHLRSTSYPFFKNAALEIAQNEIATFWLKERGDQKSVVPINEINQIVNWLIRNERRNSHY